MVKAQQEDLIFTHGELQLQLIPQSAEVIGHIEYSFYPRRGTGQPLYRCPSNEYCRGTIEWEGYFLRL